MSSVTGGRTVDVRNGGLRLAGIAPPAGDNLRMIRISRAAAAGSISRLQKVRKGYRTVALASLNEGQEMTR